MHYAGRGCQPRLRQGTVCCWHRILCGGQPPIPPYHKHSTMLLATSVQPSPLPIQTPPPQLPAGSCQPDSEIKSTVANMQRHEQVSRMLPTGRDQKRGRGSHCPLYQPHPIIHLKLLIAQPYRDPQEDWRLKNQELRPLLLHSFFDLFWPYAFLWTVLYWNHLDFSVFLYRMCSDCVLFRVPCK